ncbi:MarR family winged helix-turn-helix transcriptional regulator [Tomitella biformata]|uniref:MarR family winged helix-turn-helix transcriptional regulator n=1 Tax=Tomitella biformata TaxID=630403 RepID=UPI000467BD82|nr:MarR family transcriptional regulator [Tomitella biformata]
MTGEGASTRWLDGQELDAWLQVARILSWVPAELDARLLREDGITHFEYEVLASLSESADRRLRMSVLAGLANGSLSRLSHVVRRLEQRGWVTRERCPDDRRATYAVLTDDGYAKVVATAPGYVEHVRSLTIDPLDREQIVLLAQIGQRLNDAAGRGGLAGLAGEGRAASTGAADPTD